MAIKNRTGWDLWFDPNKMLPGEMAVSTDAKKVYVAFAPGDVREFAFKDQIPIVGDITPDKLQEAVDNYLNENPVHAGATEEETKQIERNKRNIENLSTSDTKNNIVTFETEDLPENDDNPLEWKEVNFLTSGEKHDSILKKISAMFRNIRYLYKSVAEFNGKLSHVGMIIHSTTLDTMEKVIAIYGGAKWEKIEGRFLLGASNSYSIGTTGGEATHTLTVSEMPSHKHNTQGYVTLPPSSVGADNTRQAISRTSIGGDPIDSNANILSAGGGAAHNNMPPYQAVYIWERIE